jgi:hypothetical protein
VQTGCTNCFLSRLCFEVVASVNASHASSPSTRQPHAAARPAARAVALCGAILPVPSSLAPGAPLVTAHDCLRLRRAYRQSARGCSPVCRDAGERLLDGGPRLCWGRLEITWGRPWLHGMLLITCGHLWCDRHRLANSRLRPEPHTM